MRKKRFEHCVGDGVFGQHGIDLLNSEVDFIQALAQRFHLGSETLKLGAVHHVVRFSVLVEVEEGPVLTG